MKNFWIIILTIIITWSVYNIVLINFKNVSCSKLQCLPQNIITTTISTIQNTTSNTSKNNQDSNIITIQDSVNEYYVTPNNNKELRNLLFSINKIHKVAPYTILESSGGDPAINGDWIHIKYEKCDQSYNQCEIYFYDNVIDILNIKNIKTEPGNDGIILIINAEQDNIDEQTSNIQLDTIELRMRFDSLTENLYIQKKIINSR